MRRGSAPLSRRLLLLACAGIVPLALMSGIGLHVLGQQHRVQAERVGLELARAIATAVDAELRSTISVLESLATTFALDGDDLPAFRERARRVLATQPQWAGVTLADQSGAQIVDTRFGAASRLPPIAERQSFDRVVRTGAPAVGSLEALSALREWHPDVLVSDIEMPGEDGYAFIRRVRALDAAEGGRTPAVALTAYGRTQDRILSLAAGYSMHVPKPVDPGELTAIIASVAARPPQVTRP